MRVQVALLTVFYLTLVVSSFQPSISALGGLHWYSISSELQVFAVLGGVLGGCVLLCLLWPQGEVKAQREKGEIQKRHTERCIGLRSVDQD